MVGAAAAVRPWPRPILFSKVLLSEDGAEAAAEAGAVAVDGLLASSR